MKEAKLLYVYILKCADDSYYTGVTNNVEHRLAQHNEGLDKGCYTFKKRPVALVLLKHFKFISKQLLLKNKLKAGQGKRKKH